MASIDTFERTAASIRPASSGERSGPTKNPDETSMICRCTGSRDIFSTTAFNSSTWSVSAREPRHTGGIHGGDCATIRVVGPLASVDGVNRHFRTNRSLNQARFLWRAVGPHKEPGRDQYDLPVHRQIIQIGRAHV